MKTKKKKYVHKAGVFERIFSFNTLIVFLFLAQIVIIVLSALYLYEKYYIYYWLDLALRIVALIVIMASSSQQPYKTAWLIVITLLPIVGAAIYLLIRIDYHVPLLRKKDRVQRTEIKSIQKQEEGVIEKLDEIDPRYSGLARYLSSSASAPLYQNNNLTYFPSGEASLESILESLRNAKKFIFIEFFIVKDGWFLQEILDILVEKVKSGVEVKFMYDGFNEITGVPRSYKRFLRKIGIETRVFKPLETSVFHRENNRSHRKSIIVDGVIAYTGGLNIGDEYINKIKRFGYWKDTVIKVEGESVNSFTLNFLAMWDMFSKTPLKKEEYIVYEQKQFPNAKNFVAPFSDSPVDSEDVGYDVYIDIINKAVRYVYISTPYLVIENDFMNALKYASKRGVEIRILVPFIPDKKMPNNIAKSHYKELIDVGVKVYEYTPGFNHAKVILSDDVVFVVGSINLDYRSFYLSFENAVFAYDPKTALIIKEDLESCFNKSNLIDETSIKKISKFKIFLGYLSRLFTPLL